MNQAQRNFLIKKIEDTAKTNIKALKDSAPEYPNLEKYLLHAIMSGKFELQPTEHMRKAILNKVLTLKERDTLLGDPRNSWSNNHKIISLNVEDVFVIPTEFEAIKAQYQTEKTKIDEQVRSITIQSDTLVTRIQLASDKTLDRMINEIDDMGDISLMDTKIKLLSNGQ